MVNKRPQDRPPWDDVLNILSQPNLDSTTSHPAVSAAVEAAIARRQLEQTEQLNSRQKQSEQETQLGLYRHACDLLLQVFSPLVEEFNQQFQHGQITYHRMSGFMTYEIPSGLS